MKLCRSFDKLPKKRLKEYLRILSIPFYSNIYKIDELELEKQQNYSKLRSQGKMP